ncbi:hypothetical protein TNCV_5104231 [Trichonephila clavipes]|nr:hypothetical protein TNCV_5104231 [Trichonephila clavipes]
MTKCIEYEILEADHVYYGDFQGSVLKIGAAGANRIFQHIQLSNEALNKHTIIVTGDSKCLMSVKDTYGKGSVTKYECIRHVQKIVLLDCAI